MHYLALLGFFPIRNGYKGHSVIGHSLTSFGCPLPQSRYGKQYSPKNYHVRNKIIAGTSDYIVAFVKNGDDSPGTMSTINYAKKFEKKYVIIN